MLCFDTDLDMFFTKIVHDKDAPKEDVFTNTIFASDSNDGEDPSEPEDPPGPPLAEGIVYL